MRVGFAYAMGLGAAVLLIVVSMSCAPQRTPRVEDPTLRAEDGVRMLTAEDVIREHDLERLWTLEEFAAEQHQLDADIALLEQEVAQADYASRSRTRRTMEHVGRATWSVFVVAFTLGMAALPFLI